MSERTVDRNYRRELKEMEIGFLADKYKLARQRIHEDRDAYCERQGQSLWLTALGLVFGFSAFLLYDILPIWVMLPCAANAVLCFGISFYLGIPRPTRAMMVWDEVHRRLSSVPPKTIRNALRCFGEDGYPWECAAIECHESHMCGDCPLCGAE